MARSLRLRVVAEGVETAEQAEFLLARGCNICQGYLYSRPLAAVDLERFARTALPAPESGAVPDCDRQTEA